MSTGSCSDGSACRRLTDWRFASSAAPKRTVISWTAYCFGAGVGSASVVGVGASSVGGVLPPVDGGGVPTSWPVCSALTRPLSGGDAEAVSCLATPNGFFGSPRTLRRDTRASAGATIGWEASSSDDSVSVAGVGGAGAGGAGSLLSAIGTAARAATSKIATGQRRRWTNWRQRLVTALLIGLQ